MEGYSGKQQDNSGEESHSQILESDYVEKNLFEMDTLSLHSDDMSDFQYDDFDYSLESENGMDTYEVNFGKVNCKICSDTFFICDVFICIPCKQSICFNCFESHGKWIHIKDDCDLCYEIYNKKIENLHHTLYFVCSDDCEHIFIASYF